MRGQNRPKTNILETAVFVQTTRFTCGRVEALVSKLELCMKGSSYLKEPLQPPHLEYPFSHQDGHLKDTPPLDPPICTLRRVPVHLLPHHNVSLLILDLFDEHRQQVYCKETHINQQSAIAYALYINAFTPDLLIDPSCSETRALLKGLILVLGYMAEEQEGKVCTFILQWIYRLLRLWHELDPMHIKRNHLRIGRRVIVAEAINMFALPLRYERMLPRRHAPLVVHDSIAGILDLVSPSSHNVGKRYSSLRRMMWGDERGRQTQKSISRFPAPPNSRSPI